MEQTVIKLKKTRQNKRYTQEFMAKRLGLSIRAYSKIERGETQLTVNRLRELSQILGVSMMELLGDDTSTTQQAPQNAASGALFPQGSISMQQHYEETIAMLKDQIETLKAIIEKMKF